MEVDNNLTKKKSGGVLTFFLGFLSVLILFGALGGVAYYYFVFKGEQNSLTLEEANTEALMLNEQELSELVEQVKNQRGQIQALQEENATLKAQGQKGIAERLSYIIKPKSQFVVECYNAELGKWKIPANCAMQLKNNVAQLLKSDKRILALEIIGVVDEKQYKGRSPELKQEGLASFRASAVMMKLNKDFPNVLTFKGLSVQEQMKRGFFVRAYYAQ